MILEASSWNAVKPTKIHDDAKKILRFSIANSFVWSTAKVAPIQIAKVNTIHMRSFDLPVILQLC